MQKHEMDDLDDIKGGIEPRRPETMPRAEDDATTFANSPEFHDRVRVPGGVRTSNPPERVERGGEARPDSPDKGSEADTKRHVQGIPADVPDRNQGPDRGQGRTSPRTPGKAEGE
jgi:hypothetical protein